MRPIEQLTISEARRIRYVLMDIDDTLTTRGKLVPEAYQALWDLSRVGLYCIPVTGRPAGWCDCIVRQWPVRAVIGENGALVYWEEPPSIQKGRYSSKEERPPRKGEFFHPGAVRNDHPLLKKIWQRVSQEVPEIRIAKDQGSRLFDMAFEFAEEDPVLPLTVARHVQVIATEEGAMAKISSIHVNVWMGGYTKLDMARLFLERYEGWNESEDRWAVFFIGDSPNDEPMFEYFPLTCGVANVKRYQGMMKTLPGFVCRHEGGEGFAEFARILLERRQ